MTGANPVSEQGRREARAGQSQQFLPCPEARLRVRAAFTDTRILKQGHWGRYRIDISKNEEGRPVTQTSGCKERNGLQISSMADHDIRREQNRKARGRGRDWKP